MTRQGYISIAWLLVFGAASSTWCISAARTLGATYDEPVYFDAGMHFWRTMSHRPLMRMGTMPLPVDLQTLPLRIAEVIRGERWVAEHDLPRLLPWMRHGNLLFWWLLLGTVMLLAQDIGGVWAGRLAVAAIACEPNFLAHAALATTDIAVTACLVMFVRMFLRGRDGPWRQRIGWPALWFGLALLAKASALVFAPFAMLVSNAVRIPPAGHSWRRLFHDGFAICGLGFLIALVACGSDFEPDASFIAWAKSLDDGAWKSFWIWFAEQLRIFGNAGEGLVMQIRHNLRGHGQFLLGETNQTSFWYYYPVLFAIKLPIALLIGTLLACLFRIHSSVTNPALAIAAAMFILSLTCRVQIGVRLQLPLIAFLIVGLSIEASACMDHSCVRWRWPALAGSTIAIMGMAAGSLAVWPHGLCYANALWGGSQRAYLLASDSNYDWGQGLPELTAWHKEHGTAGLDIWYFGRDPRIKSLDARELPLHCVPLDKPEDVTRFCWGRYLAVGTSLTHGKLYSPSHAVALDYLKQHQPAARTKTFLIYDLTSIGPPAAVEQASRP